MRTKHYINLTNGLEFLKIYPDNEYSFIRIQSTHCEQKRYEDILAGLSDDLLMNLALGNECIIYDTSKKTESRAIWQGVEFIRLVLRLVWFDKISILPKGMHVDFSKRLKKINVRALKKIKYYRKFLNTDNLNLKCCIEKTSRDGDYKYFSELLKQGVDYENRKRIQKDRISNADRAARNG